MNLLRRSHKPDHCHACYARGFYDAALLAKLRDDNERAVRSIRMGDAWMHDLVVLRERWEGADER